MNASGRLIVAITGASGASGASGSIYRVRLLLALRALPEVESYLILSPAGVLIATQEMDMARGDIEALADLVHKERPARFFFH